MLARSSSDAGTRLRRSKSTSTVHKRPTPVSEPIDRDVTHQHAVAAAAAAFARVQTDDVSDRKAKRSSELSRSKSNASRKSLSSQGQGSHFPPRGSSFRALQSQKTEQGPVSQRISRAGSTNTEQFPAFHPSPVNGQPLSVARPLSAQPSVTFSEHSRPSTQPKCSRPTAASSVASQQLRKARSVYYASSVQTGSPIARPPAKYLTTPPLTTFPTATTTSPAVTAATRSTVPSPLASPRLPVTVDNSSTIDQARDKYLQDFQQRSVKHKPSLFLAPFKKRQDKAKDKGKRKYSDAPSVPSSSYQTPHESSVDVSINEFLPLPGKTDKRSFSGSLKNKFRRVFRRSSKEATNLPVQQIEASRDYFGSASGHEEANLNDVPSPDEAILRRCRSRTPVVEPEHVTFLRPASRESSNGSARSQQSLHSELNTLHPSASRVTSWATSITSEPQAQRAIKRLTVIHESKDSIGSEVDRLASVATKRKSLPSAAFTAFREPMQMDSIEEQTTATVDPKRVFSALMREINTANSTQGMLSGEEHTPGMVSDIFESSQTKELHSSASRDFRPNTASEYRPPSRRPTSAAAQSSQSKTSSIRSLGRAIRSTIRTVTPKEYRSSPPLADEADGSGDRKGKAAYTSNVPPHESSTRGHDYETLVHTFSPSAHQIEKRVERDQERWKTPLDEADVLHSPRQTDRNYAIVAEGPRKVATVNVVYTSGDDPTSCAKSDVEGREVPVAPTSPPLSKLRPLMSPMSPSVYSRDEDGISIIPNDSVLSVNEQAADYFRDGGSALIVNSRSVRRFVVGTPSPTRPDSTRTSRDWKAWLSHEVSSIASISHEDLKIDESYLTPSGRHLARTSHTNHDDTTVILHDEQEVGATQHPNESLVDVSSVAQTSTEMVHSIIDKYSDVNIRPIVFEKSCSHPDTFKEVSPVHTPTTEDGADIIRSPFRPDGTPITPRERPVLTPTGDPKSTKPVLETPKSARMNERFPYIQSARRSSNNSNSSRKSKSPTESIATPLRATSDTPSPRIYSDLTAPATDKTSYKIPATALKRTEMHNASKENATPASSQAGKGNGRPSISTLGLTSRAKSLQPLSSATLNRAQPTIHSTEHIPSDVRLKHQSSPVVSSLQPRIRATLRPISPDKQSRRPRSAFDLRSINTAQPRPASELRRPALMLNASTRSLVRDDTLHPADDIVDRSGSVTPGQRMADKFLKERKSTGVLIPDTPRYRGGLKLTREDTPAFL